MLGVLSSVPSSVSVHCNMEGFYCIIAAVCMAVSAAPPAPPRIYPQHASAHLQSISPLDYFMNNHEEPNYYNQAQQKQGNAQGAPSRLESLEPDSEVELIAGAQQPQQPPQQSPVSPNLPGLAPGQRVFIVHMPVPGYRPGTIGGYQPVYIVAAAPQGNPGYAANGYQNAILLNPSGQVVSPYLGYQGVAQQTPQGLVLGGQLPFNRPFEQLYQDQFAYQPAPVPHGPQGVPGTQGSLHLSQLVSLQGQQPLPANKHRTASNEAALNSDPMRVDEVSDSEETKETNHEPRRNARPGPAHAQIRNKV